MRSLAWVAPTTLLLAACPNPQERCAPSCAGCCDVSGTCQLGQTELSCGAAGNACVACGLGLACSSGQCSASVIGGGGGGGSGGGGTGGGSGGGAATQNQELVSGTRLRAINFVGADGSKSPWAGTYFYDTQLETVCTPTGNSSSIANTGGACVPLSSFAQAFSDSACTNPLGRPAVQPTVLGRPFRNYLVKATPDGGGEYFLQSSTPYVGPIWDTLGFSACQSGGTSDGGQFPTVGSPVSLVTMTATID